jgi:predicted amidohydrolase YtcJ
MDKKIEFYDSHLHLLGLGYVESLIDLNTYKSINSLLSLKSSKDLILGRGWHQNNFKEKRYPTKADLNKISSTKPVIFLRVCGHVLVCNDKAMELSNINASSLQIEGGTFEYSTGIFTEDALNLIFSIIPSPSKEDIKEMFISDDFSTLQVPYELIIECLTELYNDGLMQVKLYEQVNLPSKKLLLDYINKGYHKKKFNGFRMGPLKLLADGSLGGRTAYLKEPYTDDPSTRGIKVFKDEDLEELIYIADSNGMDVAIHAIGDGIIDIVLNAIEKSLAKTKRVNHRHSIIHAQLANIRQIKRMKKLGVSVIVQPIFLNSDIPIIEKRLGKKRAKESYLFKTMYNEGIRVGFSTDAPVEDVNPLDNIKVAMTRKSIKYPKLGEFLPDEKFTYEESIECYTKTNLWLSYENNSK